MTDSSAFGQPPPEIDTSVAHSARVWNYFLGGKDNFPVDREAGDEVLALMPEIVDSARADRAFLGRVVRYLAGEYGVRQFLDIGTGLPTADNTHEVAQRVARDARIVYVDNDPLVLVHARALLTSGPAGVTDYIEADVRDPDTILEAAAKTLDFSQPVALMLLGILNFVLDDDEAHAIVDRLLDGVPSGSYMAVVHPTREVHSEAMAETLRLWKERGGAPIVARSRQKLARFFDRLKLLEPGVVPCWQWRPDPGDPQVEVAHFCAVGRKP
jgi:O-methyltransferase involved in polyketide biosynthesis